MKKIKLIAGAISLMLIAAVIASCGLNPFGKVAKPGKYEGIYEDENTHKKTKYEFFFTNSSAYKVIIKDAATGNVKYKFYGKGEEKDDGFRAAASETKIDVRYQAGTVAKVTYNSEKTLSYVRSSDNNTVKLEFKEALPEFTTTLKDSKYSYSGTGCIDNYNNGGTTGNRPWGDLNTNTDKNVKYMLNFYDTGKAYLEWEEDGVKRYFWAKEVVYKKNHRINMTFDEIDGPWNPGSTAPTLKAGGLKDSKRYAVFDPQNDKNSAEKPILAFENAPLKKE